MDRLSRVLAHTSISTTRVHLRSMGLEHLQERHAKFSHSGDPGIELLRRHLLLLHLR